MKKILAIGAALVLSLPLSASAALVASPNGGVITWATPITITYSDAWVLFGTDDFACQWNGGNPSDVIQIDTAFNPITPCTQSYGTYTLVWAGYSSNACYGSASNDLATCLASGFYLGTTVTFTVSPPASIAIGLPNPADIGAQLSETDDIVTWLFPVAGIVLGFFLGVLVINKVIAVVNRSSRSVIGKGKRG